MRSYWFFSIIKVVLQVVRHRSRVSLSHFDWNAYEARSVKEIEKSINNHRISMHKMEISVFSLLKSCNRAKNIFTSLAALVKISTKTSYTQGFLLRSNAHFGYHGLATTSTFPRFQRKHNAFKTKRYMLEPFKMTSFTPTNKFIPAISFFINKSLQTKKILTGGLRSTRQNFTIH